MLLVKLIIFALFVVFIVLIVISQLYNKHWFRKIYHSHSYSIFVKNIGVLALLLSILTTIFTYMVNQNVTRNNTRSAKTSRNVARQTKDLMNLSAPVYYDMSIVLTPLDLSNSGLPKNQYTRFSISSLGIIPTFKVKAGQISAIYSIEPASYSKDKRNISIKSFRRLNTTPINPNRKRTFTAPHQMNFKLKYGTQYQASVEYYLIVDNQGRLHVNTLEFISSPWIYMNYGSSSMITGSNGLLAYKIISNDDLLSENYVNSKNNWIIATSLKKSDNKIIVTTEHDSKDQAVIKHYQLSQKQIISDVQQIERQYSAVYGSTASTN